MEANEFVEPVRQFADTVLEHGRDEYGERDTPLFVDALEVPSFEASAYDARHVQSKSMPDWKFGGGDRPQPDENVLISNFATQGNFFRVLTGLSRLTGDETYCEAAEETTAYALEHLTDSRGLLYWGGHTAYDLRSDEVTWAKDKAKVHELKMDYPYYELLWDVDPGRTRRFVEAFWNEHLLDWSRVHFNRHGEYGEEPAFEPWNHEYTGAEVFYEGDGFTLKNTGSDLCWAAGLLAAFTDEDAPLEWAKRLWRQYVTTRQPGTGISGYQYNLCSVTVENVDGVRGDRATRQFGRYIPEGHQVNSGTLFKPRPGVQRRLLLLGDRLGDPGEEFVQWAREELRAWAAESYRPEDQVFEPMLTDGYSLEGFVIEDDGYFGPEGREIVPFPATPTFFWTYALGYRATGDEDLWATARKLGHGNGIGDVGTPDGAELSLSGNTGISDDRTLHGLLELYRATGREEYLERATEVGRAILSERYRDGVFVSETPDGDGAYRSDAVDGAYSGDAADGIALLGDPTPLALLHLATTISDAAVEIPHPGDRTGAPGRDFDPFDEGAYP